jgi:hypothetical protein
MISVKISSLVGDPIRELRFPGFRNTFVIGKINLNNLPESRYVIIDRFSMVILVDAYKLTDLIYRISSFLADLTQDQLDDYINTIREYNE